jgi:hypothetical protein
LWSDIWDIDFSWDKMSERLLMTGLARIKCGRDLKSKSERGRGREKEGEGGREREEEEGESGR